MPFIKKKKLEGAISIKLHVADDGTEFDQNQIFIGKTRVGYCGTKPDMPVNFCMKLTKDQEGEVINAVAQKIGTVSKSSRPVLVNDPDEKDKK